MARHSKAGDEAGAKAAQFAAGHLVEDKLVRIPRLARVVGRNVVFHKRGERIIKLEKYKDFFIFMLNLSLK